MAIQDRRARDRAARRQLITATARKLAEEEGWDAVTTRRLSTEIEYSQPVLYKHFSGMEDIIASVAGQGFGELGGVLGAERGGGRPGRPGPSCPRIHRICPRQDSFVRCDVHPNDDVAICGRGHAGGAQ